MRPAPPDPVVETLVDLAAPAAAVDAALSIASASQRAEAQRRIRLQRGALSAKREQVRARMRELERRYPGIAGDAEGRG